MQLKRWGFAMLVAGIVGLMPVPAHAIFGFGLHAGMDMTSVDEKAFGYTDFNASAQDLGVNIDAYRTYWQSISLTREAASNPILIGGHVYVDALPFIDIEVSFDVALSKYWVTYSPTLTGDVTAPAYERTEAYFGRVGVYGTVRRDLISLPMFALYVGGGLGYHFVTPVAGPDLIVDAYGSNNPTTTKPDIESLVERDAKLGWHGLMGVRFKPVLLPFAFRVEGKYTATSQDDYEKPGNIFSLYAGVSFAI